VAEFCDECRVKMGAPPGPMSDEAITKKLAEEHGSWSLLCEGCSNWIVYDSEGNRTVKPIYPPGKEAAVVAEYKCLKCGNRVSDPIGMSESCPVCGGTLVATKLVGLTEKQKVVIASVLDTDIRASLSVSFKEYLEPGQGVNVGTLFEIIGLALVKFARSVDAKGKEIAGSG